MASKNEREPTIALVCRARAGDRVAFDELVRRYRPRIYALALQMTGSSSDADDVTQDVFLRAYRALGSFEGRSQFFTWIYRMAVNLSLNLFRSRRRRKETGLEDPRIALAVSVDAHGDPVRAAELRRLYARLLAALDALSPAVRTSVVLVTLHGLRHEEAAAIQGCPTGTVAWRIHAARRRLRALIAPLDEGRESHGQEPSTGGEVDDDLAALLHAAPVAG